ncbi:MAG: DNA-directed RNA polymerase, subunit E'' [Candidatus Helarchaeota archaeon]|nr:DNA-directed RNA polymerase, subunit E'' [Candidatus Helarchaeota archaeon]
MTIREKACRTCHRLEIEKQLCSSCKTPTLSSDWSGLVIIMNPEDSKIADKLNIHESGKYALKVR